MSNINVGSTVKMVQEWVDEMNFMEKIFGEGLNLSGNGEILAVSPSPAELVELSPKYFDHIPNNDEVRAELQKSFVYLDSGAGRPFVIDLEEIKEVV